MATSACQSDVMICAVCLEPLGKQPPGPLDDDIHIVFEGHPKRNAQMGQQNEAGPCSSRGGDSGTGDGWSCVRPNGRGNVVEQPVLIADSDAIVTPCGHMFHFKCANTWVTKKPSCPTCCKFVAKPLFTKLYPSWGGDRPVANKSSGVKGQQTSSSSRSSNLTCDKCDSTEVLNETLKKQATELTNKVKEDGNQLDLQKKKIQSLEEQVSRLSQELEQMRRQNESTGDQNGSKRQRRN